ncbi:hypothetical protein ACN27G_35680 [Plantactinospora sp. WMMB334]|uniref:hypothetical protein n=1 Tax=Plantactinospora sp. WMMB334 TaxID=3404119 RepID=UPI003B94821C
MLDDDGGGRSNQVAGTTNWTSHNVRQIWELVSNQETDTHWQHVSGWRKTFELSLLHLGRLQLYRENLIEAWPPEKSEASRAYVARLDFLIETVQGVYDAAVANHQTFMGATQAIWESRRDLEEIHKEYLAKEQAKQEYDAALTANNGRPPEGKQPTTQSDLEDLNWRARHIMYGLSGELATAQMQLRQPPVYKSGRTVDEGGGGGGSGGSSVMGTGGPPVLPPVVPMPSGGGGSYTPPPTPAVQTVVPTTTPPTAGPILGGTGPIAPPAVPPAPPSVVPPPPPTTGPGLAPPAIPPTLPPGTKPPGTRPPGYPSTVTPTNGFNKAGFGPNTGPGPRAMPPGGMIGGVPGAGLAQPTTGTGAARRINPVGGVIGSGSGTPPIGGAGQRSGAGMGRGSATSQAFGMGPSGRSGGQDRDEENGRNWDPDNPWETDEGVAPVMMPARNIDKVDPGPAIGHNR